jgi:hypothetical protein
MIVSKPNTEFFAIIFATLLTSFLILKTMTAKLTLILDAKVIEAAKEYSAEKGIDLSSVVEDYLKVLIPKRSAIEKRASIMELKGILGEAPKDFDYREERYKYLMEKHK